MHNYAPPHPLNKNRFLISVCHDVGFLIFLSILGITYPMIYTRVDIMPTLWEEDFHQKCGDFGISSYDPPQYSKVDIIITFDVQIPIACTYPRTGLLGFKK